MKSFVYRTFAVLAVTACVCLAAPEPAVVQRPDNWTVEMTFEHPQKIMVRLPGENSPKLFWYLIVTLTNRTKQDVGFYPNCELMTASFQIIPAGKNTNPIIFQRIKKRHQSRYPLLESLEQAGSRILQGRDNAKDIAIIWPDFDPQAKHIDIFLSGLSNETVVVDHPLTAKKIYLRKTLELSYDLRGDLALRPYLKLAYKDKHWIMR